MIHNASPATPLYNCIAFAYDCEDKWFDPYPEGVPYPFAHIIPYWPEDVPRNNSLDAFIALYRKIGYEKCEYGTVEIGYLKIALLLDDSKEPIHATKQLENGYWASKLGEAVDVIHLIPDIIDYYKNLCRVSNMEIVFMKRPRNKI